MAKSKTACIDWSRRNLEAHQTGFDGEHIAMNVLEKLGHEGIETTLHKDAMDLVTDTHVLEVKTFTDATKKDLWQISVDAEQKAKKLAFAAKHGKKPACVAVVKDGEAIIYMRDGVGKFRVPGRMKEIGRIADWKKTIGTGRKERFYVPR